MFFLQRVSFPYNALAIQMEELVSQAAACDGLINSVNYNGQNADMQGYSLPLFED